MKRLCIEMLLLALCESVKKYNACSALLFCFAVVPEFVMQCLGQYE